MSEPSNIVTLTIPPRSHLYHLELIGVGTPLVESLSGYVARLALAHHVTPKSLISYEILPFQGKDGKTLRHYSRLSTLWLQWASSLNSLGPVAEEWVHTLTALTLCDDLRFSTMLTWSKAISLSRLLNRSKAWCPECYKEWKCTGHVIYEPLLWAVQPVSVCPVHRCCLHTACPYEDCKSKEPLLTQTSRPGYCSRCTRWLGISVEDMGTNDAIFNIKEQKWQYWVANAVGDLIAAAPNLQNPPCKEQVELTITKCVEQIANGNMNTLARLLNLNVESLRSFKYRGKIPYFETLLHICFRLSIPPLEFLTNDALSALTIEKRSKADDSPILTTRQGVHLKASDVEKIRSVLEAEVAKDGPPYSTLAEITKMLGCSPKALHRYCPEICNTITSRRFEKLNLDDFKKKQKNLEEILLMENPPTLIMVAKMLGCPTNLLRKQFPNLTREIVARNQEKFSFANVQKHLLRVLENNIEPYPSMRETAQNLGCSVGIMLTRCPDLCRKISIKYKGSLHRKHEIRIAEFCGEVQQAVLTLHEQGTYPSTSKVGLYLSSPKVMLITEAYEVWQNMVQELGWKK